MANRERSTENEPMKDVSHTHPHTGETFGYVYKRGPAVADGGETDGRADSGPQTMADIDHTAAYGDGANDVWERGGEERADVSEPEGDVDE